MTVIDIRTINLIKLAKIIFQRFLCNEKHHCTNNNNDVQSIRKIHPVKFLNIFRNTILSLEFINYFIYFSNFIFCWKSGEL